MNPIDVKHRLQSALVRYLLTTFDVNRDGENEALYFAMREAFEAECALVSGPYLELSMPYRRGDSIRTLVSAGELSSRMLNLSNSPIPVDAPLYLHQQRAIGRIANGRSVIVSSGTGSGKTESFMIPILNDLLEHPARGVRAILIYPLNALVNDQLERLGKLLQGTDITYGRYTSELMQTTQEWKQQTGCSDVPKQEVISREQIRKKEKLPNILITNYAMLEYLLLRPGDQNLFSHTDSWKYIVLDEAHSYSGAKGVEVAYLIRRLKHHLGKQPGEMVCIGTSATLTNDPQIAVTFAETLFGEDFEPDDIIFGESQTEDDHAATYEPSMDAYLRPEWEMLLEHLRSNTATREEIWDQLSNFGLIDAQASIETDNVSALLYGALKKNGHLRRLRAAMIDQPDMPLGMVEAAQLLFPENHANRNQPADSLRALYHLVEVGASARPHPNQAALLPARYHLFARSPQGIWACLNPNCSGRPEGHTEPWSRLFGSPRLVCDMCDGAVFPLSICRTCGQVYVKTIYADEQHWAESRREDGGTPCYFVWSPREVNDALADRFDEDSEDGAKPPENPTQIEATSTTLCLNSDCRRESRCSCAKDGRTPKHVKLYSVVAQTSKGSRRTRSERVAQLECCARCGSESRIKGDEIATPITIRGMTPLSVLTMELYRQLPVSDDHSVRNKPGAGRKLLSFYDSRQGAARYAAFLQDVFNQDLYRYLVPKAIGALSSKGRSIDLTDLAEQGTRIGWDELRVFQTAMDEEIDAEFEKQPENRNRSWNNLTSAQRERLQRFTKTRILAEITTNRRGRQSLESLGLLAVRYFETEPDVSGLAIRIGLNIPQTRTLIDYLLETLRNEKIVTLPEGVTRDHSAFGRHAGNSAVVRSNPGKGEAPWVGKTERHIRCRIMALALNAAGRPSDLESVKQALFAVWEWLIDPACGLMDGGETGSYRLASSRLFFIAPTNGWQQCNHCQRIRHGEVALPCPSPRCGGTYQPINRDLQEEKNYYHYIFRQGLHPMRVEEHTAQLAPSKAQQYQASFKSGDINVLSCSTTFEMGIDLGDLQAVVMNNVPPNVANYRQRAGRAGRRVGGSAFIVTWATDRPHDQIYFDSPPEIIRGQVRIPRLTLDNVEIKRRHLNALLLGDFLYYLNQQNEHDLDNVGRFFDQQAPNGRFYDRMDRWRQDRRESLSRKLASLATLIGSDSLDLDNVLHFFQNHMERAEELYRGASSLYRQQFEEAKQQYMLSSGKQADQWNTQRIEAEQRLNRLSEEKLVDTLSSYGVLPSYSFPLYTVELELPVMKQETARLRLQRDLRRAIAEFAPGSEVVADKRLWISNGVLIRREARQVFEYRLCQECNHIEAAQVAGQHLSKEECPRCGMPYTGRSANTCYLIPDGFSSDPQSGKLAGQYVRYEAAQQSVAVSIPSSDTDISQIDFVHRAVQTNGKLYFINAGKRGNGYRLCAKCGRQVTSKDGKCPNKLCGGMAESIHLGHAITTDTLTIQFHPPPDVMLPNNHNLDFWLTLQTSLVLGATRALQIERDDIGGTLMPVIFGDGWQRSLVLYDNVPGGAGYMRDIDAHFVEVVEAALALVRCPYCTEDTSCTRCLRDYGNQHYYPYLKRGSVIQFLENLLAFLRQQHNSLGKLPMIANNRIEVLWETIASAKHKLRLAVSRIEHTVPPGKTRSWLDLLHEKLLQGIEVQLLLSKPPVAEHSHDRLVEADYLMLLMRTGQQLDVRQSKHLPNWHVVVDENDEIRRRALAFDDITPHLDVSLLNPSLSTTTHAGGIKAAVEAFEAVFGQATYITTEALRPPPTTQVHRIPGSSRRTSEADFAPVVELFNRPVSAMKVSDPYLIDRERIVNRLGAYIRLAAAQGTLVRVDVTTRDAQLERHDREEQTRAFEELQELFPDIILQCQRRTDRQEHDRWIEITRADGSKARLYIGRGLDFIRPDGTVQGTYLVIEELK
ncbi:MAG: DEAD/DEAH box helicase [Anaerolineae bacterium]|nr:DEAD/DEAH box helicase [Anaerolineae bacterium]